MSDPYQVEITTPQGTTLTSGLTQTTLTAQVWQNGALLSDTFFTGATCPGASSTRTACWI